MQPMRLRVHKVIDGGAIVTVVGANEATGAPVFVHVDQRSAQSIWDAWGVVGFDPPVEYQADCLVLTIDLAIDEAMPQLDEPAHG